MHYEQRTAAGIVASTPASGWNAPQPPISLARGVFAAVVNMFAFCASVHDQRTYIEPYNGKFIAKCTTHAPPLCIAVRCPSWTCCDISCHFFAPKPCFHLENQAPKFTTRPTFSFFGLPRAFFRAGGADVTLRCHFAIEKTWNNCVTLFPRPLTRGDHEHANARIEAAT